MASPHIAGLLAYLISIYPSTTFNPTPEKGFLPPVLGIVPVEVGNDYRNDDWTQQIMAFDTFLDALADFAHGNAKDAPLLYLAQHSMFMQFPALRDDIIIPDYLYASPPIPENYSQYQPPHTEEQLVLNAWLGPGGTISPAHTV